MKTVTRIISFATLFVSLPAMAEETLYTDGRFYTMNIDAPWAEAVLVDNGRIKFVGSNADAGQRADADAKIVSLDGRFAMPSLIDAHTHPGLVSFLGEGKDDARLPQSSKEEMFAWLEQYAKDHPDIPFVTLGEWNVDFFGSKGPNKSDLDRIFPNRPAMLSDSSGHSLWLNSKALELFNVTRDTPDLSKNISYFVRDKDGEPTGWVKEFPLMGAFRDALLREPEVMKERLHDFLTFLSNHGVSHVFDAGNFYFHDDIYPLVAELEKNGRLPLRYEGSYHIFSPDQLEHAVDEVLRLRKTYGGKSLTFNSVKIHFDGVSEINTAGMLEPFADEPDNNGGVLFSTGQLVDLIDRLAKHHINLHLHSVGDRATRVILDAAARVKEQNGGKLPILITIAHLETVAPEDIMRFRELGIHANFTPHWLGGAVFSGADKALGEERRYRSQMVHTFFNEGANVTFSSDVVTATEAWRANPFFGMQIGVTRQEPSLGKTAKIFPPASERATVGEMIEGYTLNAARQLGIDQEVGSIEPGKLADFIVLDHNPFAVDVYELKDLKVVYKVIDGENIAMPAH